MTDHLLRASLLLMGFAMSASAQVLGQDVCACSPGSYEITFDFNLFCPPTNITEGGGVEDISCLISPFGAPGGIDLEPVSVEQIDVLEFNDAQVLIAQDQIFGPFFNGDTTKYDVTSMEGVSDLLKKIQFNTYGTNAQGETVLNILSIVYTNDCENYPVLDEQQTAGWFRFTGLGLPQSGLCPLSETSVPSETPSAAPSRAPAAITQSPTTGPSLENPTSNPTSASKTPTFQPSEADIPTDSPTIETITLAPAVASVTPSASPDETKSPTLSPTISSTKDPTTAAPTSSPSSVTLSPVSDTMPSSEDMPSATEMSMSMVYSTFENDLEEFGRTTNGKDGVIERSSKKGSKRNSETSKRSSEKVSSSKKMSGRRQ